MSELGNIRAKEYSYTSMAEIDTPTRGEAIIPMKVVSYIRSFYPHICILNMLIALDSRIRKS